MSPLCLICAKIVGMDKIIKTISESGAFRAYVLDSTETVRTAQEKHHTQASSTVALGRTLIASQILAANEKGDTKITVKVLGTSSLGAIITVADTKGNIKGYVQNPGVDIKKTATGEVLVGPFVGNGEFLVITDYGTGNPYNSMTPLVTGEIGEDLAFYLTESQQTPSAVGLNVLLDEEDKVKVLVASCSRSYPMPRKKKSRALKNASKKCLPSPHFWNLKTILKLFFLLSMGMNLSNASLKKNFASSATAAVSAF